MYSLHSWGAGHTFYSCSKHILHDTCPHELSAYGARHSIAALPIHCVLISLADIDECAEGSHSCEQNCHNNVGSYTCSCRAGYRLAADGRSCIGELIVVCVVAGDLRLNFALSYPDIDECAENTDGCAHNCHNTAGSYYCSCNTGYRLNADGHACDGESSTCLSSSCVQYSQYLQLCHVIYQCTRSNDVIVISRH